MTSFISNGNGKVTDYMKVYDLMNFIVRGKARNAELDVIEDDFLKFYSYCSTNDFEDTVNDLTGCNLAELFRQAENLLQLENNNDDKRYSYMNEVGTDYISADEWKTLIMNYISLVGLKHDKDDFYEIIESSAV